jgi:hypothetical protein
MPRVEVQRVFPGLWLAWVQNDYGERLDVRRGFTAGHAHRRTVAAHIEGNVE